MPGCLIATEEALEFVETRARITASTFLGVRAVDTVRVQAQGSTVSSGHRDAQCQVLVQEDDNPSTAWREHSRDGSSAGAGVISGTAAWLLQRMRRNSSASGASAAGEATAEESADSAPGLPSFVGDMWVAHAGGTG